MSTSLCTRLSTSIVKKVAMGVTGLLLCGFLVSHLLGNLLIIVGPKAFNFYAHTLTSNPLIYVAEAVLALIFLVHLFMAIRLTIENKMARPISYYAKKPSPGGSTFASSTMIYTGIIIFIFLVLHLLNLKFGTNYPITYDGLEIRDLYRTLIEYFSKPINVGWYIIAMAATAVHVSHGLWSAFQSIGFNHPKYTPFLKCKAKAFALVVFLGFSMLPIYCYMQGGQS